MSKGHPDLECETKFRIKEYIFIVLKYPIDFLLIYVDRAFVQIIYDTARNRHVILAAQFIMLFFFIYYINSIIYKGNRFFVRQILIVGSVVSSIIPSLVLVAEMRYGLSFQALIWGIAIFNGVKERDAISKIRVLLACTLFVFVCFAFYSALVMK